MHTMEFYSRWRIHHNGDFSGDVTLVSPDGVETTVPFAHLFALVAEKVRRDRIATLEQADTKQLLA